ncbi:hypothetical protein ACSBR2_008739 [Camellia fascicularis]
MASTTKRKERTLIDLFTLTHTVAKPPEVLSRDEKGLDWHSKSRKVLMRAESGMCNVCSAPCSSCLHINRALMGLKTDEFSDETCQGNADSQFSVNDVAPVNSTAFDSGQHTASETSNLLSINSNHDSFFENAESKSSLRNCEVSGASEDVKMHPNLSSGVPAGDDQLSLKPQYNSDQRALTNKLEDQKVIECHEDSNSCVSGSNDTNKLASYNNGNVGKKNIPHGSASVELSSLKVDLIVPPSSIDRIEGISSPKLCPSSGKYHSCNSNVRDLEEDLGSHPPIELPEFSKEHLNLSLTKEATSDMVCKQRSASYTCGGTDNGNVGGSSSAALDRVCLNFEAETETGKGSGELPTEAVNSSGKIEEVEKVVESCGLPDVQETSLQSQPVDDSDGSDIVEHDVKVCDICGDAGREDLLAICSRCSDGAEHTYCMREMMDKVPESDWLCEECKFDEEFKNLKQDKIVTSNENDKNQSSGLASALNTNLFVKLDKKDSYVEGNETNKDILSAKASSKRHAENIEVASALKRQSLEPTVGSPKISSPSRTAALSHDLSFRKLDKGKVKPAHQLSSGTCSIDDTSEAAFSRMGPRLQTPRGALSKSNSFNSTNAKPKVKLADEVVPQKQKSPREPASLDMKDGTVRLIGKSMSSKSFNLGRLNPLESKVKMLSPKFSHGQDLKGLKQAKEWNLPERKNSFKSERSMVSSAMGNTSVSTLKGDKKIASYGESYSLPSVSNHRELKGVQSDTKFSKPTSHVAHKGSEISVPLGEIKRQSCSSSVVGDSTNGINGFSEQKPIQTSLPYDRSSSTFTAERPFRNANEDLPNVLSRPRESTNLGERIKESSVNHSRPSIATGGRSLPCPKCNEIGHSAQSCSIDNPRSIFGDARSSREVMNKGNKLKAAIEAAMLKKPGIYRKTKMPYQSDELSLSSTNLTSEIRPQDQLQTSINARNISEVHEAQAVQPNSTTESCKQKTINNIKQLSAVPAEVATLKTGDIIPIHPSDGKPCIRDSHCNGLASVSALLKMSTIPEHEFIWQGGFEVQKSGKLSEFCDGMQAHLSTCASPKVLEVVNKFSSKILLNEVSRLSSWPTQFQEIGVKEDNVALYFFAKDLESYEKSYKSLLETMMKSDLALKGHFDSVELLIFPSNHLPEKSQRWNMLYFLWGVFRGKKVNCLQDVSGFPKKYCIPRDLPGPIMSLPESICSLGPITMDLPLRLKASSVGRESECPASMESPCLSSETIKGDCDTIASSLDPKGQCTQANAGAQDCELDTTSLPSIQRTSALSFQETRCTSTPLEENVYPESKLEVKLQPSVQAAGPISGSKKGENMPMYNVPNSQQILSRSSEISGRVNSSKNQVIFERTLKEELGSLDTNAVLQRDTMMRDQTVKEVNNWHFNHGKCLDEDSKWTVSQASAGVSPALTWKDVDNVLLDAECASKKQRTGYSGLYVCNSSGNKSSSRESFMSGIHDAGTSSPIKKGRVEEARVKREVSKDNGTAERYFFPVDPNPVKDLSSGDNAGLWKVLSSENEDRHLDGVPNLELALGAEMKPSKQGILPFLVGKVDLNDGPEDQLREKAATKEEEEEEEEEDVSACLSLSLSFPFPEKEVTVKPVSKVEQLVPDRRRHFKTTSMLFFDGLSDK